MKTNRLNLILLSTTPSFPLRSSTTSTENTYLSKTTAQSANFPKTWKQYTLIYRFGMSTAPNSLGFCSTILKGSTILPNHCLFLIVRQGTCQSGRLLRDGPIKWSVLTAILFWLTGSSRKPQKMSSQISPKLCSICSEMPTTTPHMNLDQISKGTLKGDILLLITRKAHQSAKPLNTVSMISESVRSQVS